MKRRGLKKPLGAALKGWEVADDGAIIEIIPYMPGDKVKVDGIVVHIITIVDYYYIVFKWFEQPKQAWRYNIKHYSKFKRLVDDSGK